MSKGVGEMVRSRSVQVKASAGTEGARRATGVPADGAAGEAGPLVPGQSLERGPEAGRGAAAAARRISGGAVAGSGRRDLPAGGPAEDRAVAGLERGLQARQGDLVAEALDAAKRHIGELSMENGAAA